MLKSRRTEILTAMVLIAHFVAIYGWLFIYPTIQMVRLSFTDAPLIGEGAFVGTNSSLVAPVKIGNGAYIGSGSVITKDVPDDAMAVERSPQNNREGGAARYRAMKMRAKKPKEG